VNVVTMLMSIKKTTCSFIYRTDKKTLLHS
jgi:hypothetical protein